MRATIRLQRRQQRAVVILQLALEPLHQQLQQQTLLLHQLLEREQHPLVQPLHPEAKELLLEVLNSLQPPPEQALRQQLGLSTLPH